MLQYNMIQALGDKLMLHRLLANLSVPQMPALLIVEVYYVEYIELHYAYTNMLYYMILYRIIVC